jgi:tetratricopeptide (TPR) repeat protein
VVTPRARVLCDRARATGYAPLEADADMELGTLLRVAGDPAAIDTYKQAIVAAERGRADDVKVLAESSLAHLLANRHRFDESRDWLALARATMTHADHRLEATVSKVEGWLFFEQDKIVESNDAFKRALPAYAEFHPRSPDYAMAMSGAATVAMMAGEPERAMKLSADSDALAIALFGEGSSFRAGVLSNRAALLLEAARYDGALAATDAALAVSADLPATQDRVMNTHFNRVEALLGLARVDAARAELDAEVAVLDAAGLDTAREDYGRHWRRLQAKVLVMAGEPARAIPIATELLPEPKPGEAKDDDAAEDSVAQAVLGEALLRTNAIPAAIVHIRAALAIDDEEKVTTPARLEEIADAKLLLAEALLEQGSPSADVRRAFDDVPARDLPARRAPELHRYRARIDGATAKR